MTGGRATSNNGTNTAATDLLAGVLFPENATEVKAVEAVGRGKEPNPMDPVVVAALDAMLAGKLAGKPNQKAKFEGTNFTVRSVLKSTAAKWEARTNSNRTDGITVKVRFDTLISSPGKPSADKRDNDKPIHLGYRLELTQPEAKDEETVAA